MSEALFFASTNPQYDDRLFIELQVQFMKIASSEHVVYTICFLFWHSEQFWTCSELAIFMSWTRNSMNNQWSYFGLVDAKKRASDKDLPVLLTMLYFYCWMRMGKQRNDLFFLKGCNAHPNQIMKPNFFGSRASTQWSHPSRFCDWRPFFFHNGFVIWSGSALSHFEKKHLPRAKNNRVDEFFERFSQKVGQICGQKKYIYQWTGFTYKEHIFWPDHQKKLCNPDCYLLSQDVFHPQKLNLFLIFGWDSFFEG